MTKKRSSNHSAPAGREPGDAKRLAEFKERAERSYARVQANGESREIAIYKFAHDKLHADDNMAPFEAIARLQSIPVTIDEFVASEEFLGGRIEIWPTLMDDLRAMNPDVFIGEAPVHEALLGGATATGKTTLALVTNLYQLYLLTCFRDVKAMYGLSSQTRIIFMLQSLSPAITQRVIYAPFRELFESMPYAQRSLEWNRSKQSSLELGDGLMVVPELANVHSIVGQAIVGGILDEVNFMTIVERSLRVPGPRGQGGRYDQAEEVYRHLSRRRRARFTTCGFSIGCLCVISSTRYQDDFLDRRMAEVERLDEENVVVVRHKQYEVAPPDRYSGETFRLLVGNEHHATRILEDGDEAPESATVENVPIEYAVDFRRDPENALRDIVGIATDTISPFIGQRHKIVDAILAGRERGLRQWVDRPDVDLAVDGLPQWNDEALPEDRGCRRFIHVDLSLTRDRCGVAIVKVAGMVNQDAGGDADCNGVERLPQFDVEAAITIKPSACAELDIGDLRSWLMQLVWYYEFDIAQISFDGFQSRESIQTLHKAGIRAEELSVDRTPEPYEYLRRCLYHNRVAMVESDTLRVELAQLEFNTEKNKIDHPPRGSKDLADAVCGAIYAASQWRSVRADVGYHDPDGQRSRARPYCERPSGYTRPQGLRIRRRSLKQCMQDYYHREYLENLLGPPQPDQDEQD